MSGARQVYVGKSSIKLESDVKIESESFEHQEAASHQTFRKQIPIRRKTRLCFRSHRRRQTEKRNAKLVGDKAAKNHWTNENKVNRDEHCSMEENLNKLAKLRKMEGEYKWNITEEQRVLYNRRKEELRKHRLATETLVQREERLQKRRLMMRNYMQRRLAVRFKKKNNLRQ